MNKASLLAVVLPVVVLGVWVGRLSWDRSRGVEVRFAVSGFDPRDLLAGHYLQYTVNYGPLPVCPQPELAPRQSSGPRCLCLAQTLGTENFEATWVGACAERPDHCSLFIQGVCSYDRFEAHIERFYIPEAFQTELSIVPKESAIAVVLTPSGEGQVTRFLVDGVDALDYAKANAAVPK